MAADPRVFLVLAVYHGHRVPASQALQSALQLAIAGIGHFLCNRNSVDVGRVELDGDFHSRLVSAVDKGRQQTGTAIGALVLDHLVEGFEPLRHFLFRIHLRLCGKLDDSPLDVVSCHYCLNKLPPGGGAGASPGLLSQN